MTRRNFCKILSVGGLSATLFAPSAKTLLAQTSAKPKPATNVSDALKYERKACSMPGMFPGKVVQVYHKECITNKIINYPVVEEMVKTSMLKLTGEKNISDAWRMFVSPQDRIGLKINPVAGVLLSTCPEIVRAIIQQLKKAGIPDKNILIWDRREFEMHEIGFTKDNFPGIEIIGTERKDEKGSFYDANNVLYSEQMIDKKWYYWADTEEKYDAETIPYMVNEGKYSYFSNIVTEKVDKIINIPILKNAGASVTLCLKNLAYGSVTNTGRLHKELWSETCAEVCAFPPLRDKVVLNIVDGIKGCYNGGPGANEQFITEYKSILAGTDPVAVDRIGYEIVLKKRLEEKIQKEESPRGRLFLTLAENLKLGIADINKIELTKVELT
ncbi:TPA: DUF362 domain-containing protein [bacterium]|nr:DUF362 domain-containing protein [bacterium]